MTTTVLLAQPDGLPPRTTTVDITAPRFELHREGDAYRVGHPGFWVGVSDLHNIPDAILTIAAVGYMRAGAR